MKISDLEKIIDIMRKKKVSELKMDDLSIKLADDMDEETKEAIEKMKVEQVSDDDILMNPYAGLEE